MPTITATPSTNCSKGCKKFKLGKSTPNPFTLEEYQRIIDKGCRHDSHKNFVTLAVYTGLRTGEIRALAWEDIDLEAGTITVRRNIAKDEQGEFFKLTKTDESRTIQLLPPALDALLAQRQYTCAFPTNLIVVRIDHKTTIEENVRPVF